MASRLKYNPEKQDIDSIYYSLFNHFYKLYLSQQQIHEEYSDNTKEEDKLDKIITILHDISSKHNDSKNKIQNNINSLFNPTNDKSLTLSKPSDYVYIAMLQHTLFPHFPFKLFRDGTKARSIYDHNTDNEMRGNKRFHQYIKKLPENVTLIDIIDSGGMVKCNRKYEKIILNGDFYSLMKGDLDSFLRKFRNKTEKKGNDYFTEKHSKNLIKFVEKNTKIFMGGDFYINYFNVMERFKAGSGTHWMFMIKEGSDNTFKQIKSGFKHKNSSVQENIREFYKFYNGLTDKANKKMNRSFYVTTETIIDKFRNIFPDKKIVFIPISCRPFPEQIDIFSSNITYSLFLQYIQLIDPLLHIAHKKFKVLIDSFKYKQDTGDSYEHIFYGQHGYFKKQNVDWVEQFFKTKQDMVNAFKKGYTKFFENPNIFYNSLEDVNPDAVPFINTRLLTYIEDYNRFLSDDIPKFRYTKSKTKSKSIKKTNPHKIKKQTNKTIKKCRDDQIINPLTGRCVKRDGVIGRKLLKTKTDIKKTVKKTVNKPVKKNKTFKICRDDQIINPLTGRCIKRDGVIGTKLLARFWE
jgi:hypothetical protein